MMRLLRKIQNMTYNRNNQVWKVKGDAPNEEKGK